MIWVSTEQLGIGKARSRNGKYIVVANYFPPGNVPKLFIDNVLPPLSRGDDGESRESGTHSLRAPSDKSIDNESFELEEWETTYLPFQSEAAKLSSSWDYSSVKSQL